MPTPNLNGNNPRLSSYQFCCEEAGIDLLRDVRQSFENPPSVHRHQAAFQVLFILEGALMMCLPSGTHRLRPGDSCIIPAGVVHHSAGPRGIGAVRFLDFRIRDDGQGMFARYVRKKQDQFRGRGEPDRLVELASRLREFCAEPDDGEVQLGGVLACIWELLHICYENESATLPDEEDSEVDVRVRIVDQRMREMLHENTSIDQFAEFVHLSRCQLTRLYLKAYGESPPKRYRTLRLNLAKELLRFSSLSGEEIGRRCGFQNPSHFSRVFHQHIGQTPGAYRTHAS